MGVVALYHDNSAVSNILAEMLKWKLNTVPALLQLSALAPSAHSAIDQAGWGGAQSDTAIIQPGMLL